MCLFCYLYLLHGIIIKIFYLMRAYQMKQTTRLIQSKKNIALIAHDHCKNTLLAWCHQHKNILSQHSLIATGTTGHLIQKETGLDVLTMLSGPMGGDQQIGAHIAEGKIDMLIFFWDPLNAVPHDPDVKALLRIATVWNIPVATNLVTADLIINSDLISKEIEVSIPDYTTYIQQRVK